MSAPTDQVYYDPYDVDLWADPYRSYKALRDHAPLYYNERYDFFAVSRYEDVRACFADHDRLLSGRGVALDQIKTNYQFPPGTLIYEDEPVHGPRRALLARVFTPKKLTDLEPQTRAYAARCLDQFVGAGSFDFATDIGNKIPMRVIGMMLGIPEEHQDDIKRKLDSILDQKPGEKWEVPEAAFTGEIFADYVDWRVKNPSDDLMTQLVEAEFEDETGTRRRLTRPEVLSYVNILASAGNETTGLLIGWIGKLLGEHPDQRRALIEDPTLIPGAVEESLRFEPSSQAAARYVGCDVEMHGQVMPEGSALMLLIGAANRDERTFTDPDVYNVRRQASKKQFGFSHGIHVCLGAALARLEGRIVIEEVLRRFPDWRVDTAGAEMRPGNVGVRGWDKMPVLIP
jgi:cytochrome P450